LLPNLSVDYNIGFVRNHYDTSTATATLYEQLLNIPANVPVLDYKDWEQGKWANPEGWFNPWYPNPYYTAANRRQDTRNSYLTGKVEVKWAILPWITVLYRTSLSDRFYQSKQQVQKLTYSNYARTVQTKTNIAGSIYERSLNKYRLNQDFQLALNRSVGDLNLNLILGTSYSYIDEKDIVEEAAGLVIPDLYNIGNRVGTITGSAPVKTQKNYGVWGDFVAGYKNYLFLHVTGRNDWTSLLAKQNRSYFYPSADLSFILTDAFSALNNHPVIDYLKIRGALSKTGNVNIDPYALLPTYSSVTGYSKGTYFTEGSDLVSPDLKPEITSGWELGTEFRLFKNFAEVQFNYYFTSTTGQAISASVARSSGYAGYLLNTGEVTNNGVETSLRLNPVRTRDWDLHVGGNYTHNKNFLKSLHPDAKRIGVNGSSVIFAEEGYEVNQIFVADYARDDKGRVIVDANTGYPSLGDSRRVGNTTPKHRLGVDLNLRFRNFTLSSLFEYRGGYYFASIDQGALMDFVGSSARTAYYNRERFVFPNSSYLDPVSGQYVENTNVTISDGGSGFWTNTTYNRGARTNYVYSGDYWKWREASLTYKVPKTFLDRTTKGIVQELSISLQGRNLFLWTPEANEYTDPDYSANDNNAIGVSTLGQTPPSRYFGASLSFTF
jgi:outer membrane receptor protein involved in Fe transport